MSANSFTLDDIREAAEKKYAATEIDMGEEDGTCVLVNPLRLSKEKRKALMSIQKKLDVKEGEDAAEVDQEEILANAIRLVAKSAKEAERLIELVGDDLAQLAEVFARYTKGTEMGEASASQS